MVLIPFLLNADLVGAMPGTSYSGESFRGGGIWSAPDPISSGAWCGIGRINDVDKSSNALWSFRSHLAQEGCRKVDAVAAAWRRDKTADLAYDSVAFDVSVDLEHQRLER